MFYGVGSFAGSLELSALMDSGFAENSNIWSEGGIGRVALHAVAGCVSGAASGGKCDASALSSAFSAAIVPFTGPIGRQNPLAGALISTVAGGTASVLGGGKFENGAKTGAFSYLFNCLRHPGPCTKADVEDIRRAAAACDRDQACIAKLANYAREAELPVPPADLLQVIKEVLGIGTLPINLTPPGRIVDTIVTGVGAASDALEMKYSEAGAAVGGMAYGSFIEYALTDRSII